MTKRYEKTRAPRLLETVFREAVASGRAVELEYTVRVPGATGPDGKTTVFCNPGATLWGEVVGVGPRAPREDWPQPRDRGPVYLAYATQYETAAGCHGLAGFIGQLRADNRAAALARAFHIPPGVVETGNHTIGRAVCRLYPDGRRGQFYFSGEV